MMNPKQEILQALFENNVFTGNFSELARRLGYTGRNTIVRIKGGEKGRTDKTLDTILEKLCDEYIISDNDIATIAKSVLSGKNLYSLLRETYGKGCNWHRAVLGAIITENFEDLPQLDEDVFTGLKEMKLQTPEIYYGMLAHCYIMCKEINPYTKKERKKLAAQMNELNDMMHELYPSNNRAYESALESIKNNLDDDRLTILKLIYSIRHIIREYVDESYFESFLREMGHLLDIDTVGIESFWTAPGETYKAGCILWYFRVIETKSMHRGAYFAIKLRAKNGSVDSFEMLEAYYFIFLIDENFDDIHILNAYDLPTGKVEYALYRYNSETRLLELNFEDLPETTFNLPTELRCIDYISPKNRDEKIWTTIINKLRKEQCHKFILAAINSSSNSNIEYLDDYEILNVCIDWESVTVTIDYGDEKKSYTIPIDSYPFLEQLTVSELISVARYKDSGELTIVWNNLGQYIPLKEFTPKQAEKKM